MTHRLIVLLFESSLVVRVDELQLFPHGRNSLMLPISSLRERGNGDLSKSWNSFVPYRACIDTITQNRTQEGL